MRIHLSSVLILLTTGALSACHPQEAPVTASRLKAAAGVIYGEDSRDEVTKDPRSASIAMVVRRDRLEALNKNDIRIRGPNLEQKQICPNERFREQPATGFCTATLIAPNLVLTAGHCVSKQDECAETFFVFDYKLADVRSSGDAIVPFNRVHRCSRVVVSEFKDEIYAMDYAIVELDRPVTGRTPLILGGGPPLRQNSILEVLGHGSGLPMKRSEGALKKVSANFNYAIAELDTFSGDSGAPVFSKGSNRVQGIVVRGSEDTTYDHQAGCYRIVRCEYPFCQEYFLRIRAIFESPAFKTEAAASLQRHQPTVRLLSAPAGRQTGKR